jgi:TolB-like protein/DNA-binding winged helix-turn-helix (wHTH) protein
MPSRNIIRFQIGDWLVEPDLNKISRDGGNKTLPPRVMDLLVYMQSQVGEVVSHDDIIEHVWDGAHVTESSVYTSINELRVALGDHKEAPKYIETISKRGYRLIPHATTVPPVNLAPTEAGTTPSTPESPTTPTRSGRSLVYTLAVLVALSLASILYQTQLDTRAPDTDRVISIGVPIDDTLPNSIAVLPFANLSRDPGNANFAAGIHVEILNQLGKIEDLAVIARGSVMPYAQTDQSIPELAAELHVGTVMEGTVRYEGDRVRIAVQLIDADTGIQLWSEAYDRDLEDIFVIQSDIALNITEAMKVAFSMAEQKAIAKIPTDNPEAYAHYVKGLSFLGLDSTPGQKEFDAAIALDPEFALALATKAWFYGQSVGGMFGPEKTPESQRKFADLARHYAERALAIDPDQSRAYLALGLADPIELSWAQANANFARAYELDPTYGPVAFYYAVTLRAPEQRNEALSLIRQIMVLSPGAWPIALFASLAFGGDEGIEYARLVVALVPELPFGYAALASLYARNGDPGPGLEMARKAETLLGGMSNNGTLLGLMETYRLLQRPDDVARLFTQLQSESETRSLHDGDLFQAYYALDDLQTALDHLDAAVEARFPVGVGQLLGPGLASPQYIRLWGNPRYEAAIVALRLEDFHADFKASMDARNSP